MHKKIFILFNFSIFFIAQIFSFSPKNLIYIAKAQKEKNSDFSIHNIEENLSNNENTESEQKAENASSFQFENEKTLSGMEKALAGEPLFIEDFFDENEELPFSALTLFAYQRAYNQKQMQVFYKNNDWCIELDGKTFAWAEGRLLPIEKLEQAQKYGLQKIYPYTGESRNPDLYTKEEIAELKKLGTKASIQNEKPVDNTFTALLLSGQNRATMEKHIVKSTLFGKRANVNQLIVPMVEKINAEVEELAKTNEEVKAFINKIYQIGAYNWRTIDGTAGRPSYHCYGVAIDITEANNQKVVYWEWERVWNENWMLVKQNRLWSPPVEVIKIFEKYGFIWGGTWDEYDTMHFEYRPELIELNRLMCGVY